MAENILEATPSLAGNVLALFNVNNSFLTCLFSLIGTSLIVSTPPAITDSHCPDVIWPIPVVIAIFDEIQASVTVWAGILSEKPAAKADLFIFLKKSIKI